MSQNRMALLGCQLLTVFAAGCSSGYQYEGGRWVYAYYAGSGREVRELPADEESFEVLTNDTFNKYAKDARHVFIDGEILAGADPATFEIIDEDGVWCKDTTTVFADGQPVLGADPSSFRIIQHGYARDATAAYCGNVRMKVEKLEDFEVVQGDTGISGMHPKLALLRVYGPEFEDFQGELAIMCEGWARDGVSYYYGPAKVEGEDYATFRPIDHLTAVDKNTSFFGPFTVDAWEQWRNDHDRRMKNGEFDR